MRYIRTRFPPEPNGYLHIGHAKSICLNFGIAGEFAGACNLRFDDTNPTKEDLEYVEAIKEDVHWLGFEYAELRHASDYFEVFYRSALKLIEDGKAFVCDLTADEVKEYRGTLTSPGRNSPYRDRPVAENLDLFRRMRAGEFPDGARTLRAKIDMASGNINLRDPAIYRIRHVAHQNTGDAWPIYPMYDYAHCISDAVEGITHSLCTLEFEDHRPLYDWCIDNIDLKANPSLWETLPAAGLETPVSKPRQIEFSRLNINYTVMSKRKLMALVQEGPGLRLGRPAHADAAGPAPARLQPGLAAPAGRSRRHLQGQLGHRLLDPGRLHPRGPRRARRARMAVVDPLRLVIDNLDAQHDERLCSQPSQGRILRHARGRVLERAVDRARGFHGSPGERLPPPGARRRSAPARRRHRQVRAGGEGRRARGRAALHAGSVHARRLAGRGPQGQGHHPLAQRAARGGGGAAPVRPPVQGREPDDDADGKTYRDHLNPDSVRVVQRLGRSGGRAGRQEQGLPVRAPRLLHRRPPRPRAGQAGVQSHRHPARQLGERRMKSGRACRGSAR
jgi:glutaminyl-tRNA synthetase